MAKSFRDTLKTFLKPPIRLFLGILPVSALSMLVKARTSFLDYLPLGKQYVFKRYLGHLKVNINTTYHLERQLLTGFYEPDLLEVIRRFVNPGDVCFDIGANIGAVSLARAQQTGKAGKVYAIEPGTAIYERLCANIALNPEIHEVITPFRIGFSEKSEVRTWVEDPKNPGNASFVMLEQGLKESLQLTSLDEFTEFHKIGRIDFMKIDVEGMEYEVICGGINAIEKHLPVLYYETGIYEKGFWAEVQKGKKVFLDMEKMLTKLGYSFYKHSPQGLQGTRYPDLGYNTLALPHDKASSL